MKEVDVQKERDGFMYRRKDMMGCGMALNLNGSWEIHQIFLNLQKIIKK